MPFVKTSAFERWETPCSDLISLYFVGSIGAGEQLTFTVRNEEFQYQFFFESFGSYQVDMGRHEALAASTENFPGRTCLVFNSF